MNNASLPIKTILDKLEEFAPLALKEDFDNVGLLVGDNKWPVTGVLITLDITEEVLRITSYNVCYTKLLRLRHQRSTKQISCI